MNRWRAVLLALVMLTAGCGRAPTRLAVRPLAPGEWTVLDHSERSALLQLNHTREPTLRLLTERLQPVVSDTFSLHVGDRIMRMLRVGGGAFYTLLTGPQLRRSPTDPRLYAFDYDDAIWVFKTPDSMNRLTLDYDVDSLRLRQREGVVILYWSVDPVWSGDGKFISFLSNREAVRAGTAGQSIWMIDAYTGVQRALYAEPGVSAHVDGVLGEEFVFSSSHAPGVFAVHPRTRAVRRLGDGYVMGGHPRGVALLLNDQGRLVLWHQDAADTLPPPPAGQVWSTQAAFSPSGERLALLSTDQAGRYVLHLFRGSHPLVPPYELPAPPVSVPAWTSESALIFAIAPRGAVQTLLAELR